MEGSTNKVTVGRWFSKFSKGDFDLQNEPRGKPEPKVKNDDQGDVQGVEAHNIEALACH